MPRRPAVLRASLTVAALALGTAGTGALAASRGAEQPGSPALTTPFSLVEGRSLEQRLPHPEDRYAVASGCYTLQAPAGFVREAGGAVTVTDDPAAATAFHFRATRLGEYLLATDEGRDPEHPGAYWDRRAFLTGAAVAGLVPTAGVTAAPAPSEDGEWRLQPAAPGQGGTPTYVLELPSRGAALAVSEAGVGLGAGTPLVLRHVAAEGDPRPDGCAVWPEIDTDTVGRPSRAGDPAGRVQGFFEAHVHGMAFEFLGGELRCGRPWHEYGVEYALGDCREENNPFNGLLEVPLGGNAPAYAQTYDPVGWPTFKAWPQNRTLTHEQYYWRWLERAYHGGLRLTTNLLVDNKALCRLYPVKKNSCNEMDGVRLQAQRLFELQDYVDAQYGGPGEGWFRIVTTPAQARQVINAGRMAVVLGIEISALFDCDEVLDQPQCTTDDIDERLQEVFDMGVRQMELVNKFDNALAGVTGDGGTTGPVVNAGNKQVTQHWWDMQTCPEETPHEHGDEEEGLQADRTQIVPTDATPEDGEGVDALAGRVLNTFGGATKGAAVPVYGPGPHCNSRGLTDLGEHLIKAMIAKGMVFDPDHMSAAAQREALDLIEGEIVPEERKAALEAGRPAVQPAVLSSHSWGNEAIYQRIYELDGVVAPRTDDAGSFVERWKVLRGYAAAQAPAGYDFGMGYGADTNGLGGQPGPRPKDEDGTPADNPVVYGPGGFPAPIGGVRVMQQSSGLRTFDINREGVSQYGMFADWFREISLAADAQRPGLGKQIIGDMLDGAETYLGIWERAVYGGGACVDDGSALDPDDLNALLGLDLERFLDAAGQPASREGDAYVYCTGEEDGATTATAVRFDATGTAASVEPVAPDALPVPLAEPSGHAHDGHVHAPAVTVEPDLALGGSLVLGLSGLLTAALVRRRD